MLLACVALSGCGGEQAAGQAQAGEQVRVPSEPIAPPLPCAIVSGSEDAQTLSQLEIAEGRIVRVVTRTEREEGELIWEHKLGYDESGRLSTVGKTVANGELSVGMGALTKLEYGEDGRLLESSYRDALGRKHIQRFNYAQDAEADARPAGVEVLLGERVIERLRYGYEDAPVWTSALFLPGPRFGATAIYTEDEAGQPSEQPSQTLRYDGQGALVELTHADGSSERYLYGEDCPGQG